jgi:hypothetical protein
LLLATLSRIAAAMPRGMLDLASSSINDLTA